MRAVVFKDVGEVAVEDRPLPQIQDPRDAILKVTVAALCGSDLHWYRGHQNIPKGFIPGHEFVGMIHEMGDEVQGFKPGDIVIVSSRIYRSCVWILIILSTLGNILNSVWKLFLLRARAVKSL
jgi:threonine dehydrogenase-like Zn-dependent dehydrogenase